MDERDYDEDLADPEDLEDLDDEGEDDARDDDYVALDADMDELVDDDGDAAIEDDIDDVMELNPKEQNARALAIRRAIEERREHRKLEEDLDYLDLELDE